MTVGKTLTDILTHTRAHTHTHPTYSAAILMCYSTLMMHYLGGCINWANALHAVVILSPPPCPRGPSWKTTGVEPETTCSVHFTFKKWRLNPINPSTPHLSPTCTLKAIINRADTIIYIHNLQWFLLTELPKSTNPVSFVNLRACFCCPQVATLWTVTKQLGGGG